jgi:YNFM family putative membrane transporter
MEYIEKGSKLYSKTILSLFLGSFVTFAVMYSVQPLISTFSKEFDVSPARASLSLSLTTGLLAVSMILVSALSDAVGRKKIMVASLLFSSICAAVTAFSQNFWFLLTARAIMGIALAGFPSIAMTYINEEFHPKNLGTAMGMYVSGTSIGGMVSRVVVDALTDWFSWHVALSAIAFLSLLVSAWFWKSLPDSRHFHAQKVSLRKLFSSLGQSLRDPGLLCLFSLGFLLMGSFVTLYNYIDYPLMGEPYHLSQTIVGLIFFIYLVGTFSSTFMGRMADRFGKPKALVASIGIMLLGGIVTINSILVVKLVGVALFTFGFFGGHSIASGWVGQRALNFKAQASSLYLLFYYTGSSIVGTTGGTFWSRFGWIGVIGLIASLLVLSLIIAEILPLLKIKRKPDTTHHKGY